MDNEQNRSGAVIEKSGKMTTAGDVDLKRRMALKDYTTTITILEHLNDAICFFNSFGKIEYANSSALRMLNYSLSELRGQSIDNFIVEIEDDYLYGTTRLLLINRLKLLPVENTEALLRGKDRLIPVIIDCHLITGSDLTESYYLFTAKDMSRQRQTETERQESRALTIYRERMKTVGGLSVGLIHAVSQPLLALQLQTEILQQNFNRYKENPAKGEEKLREINRLIGRITDILKNIRQFAEGTREGRLEWVSIGDAVNRAHTLLSYEMEERKIDFHADLAEDLPRLLGNPMMLTEGIFNLMKNSLEALQPEGNNMEIRFTARQIADSWLELRVEDNALSIPVEIREKIFEPFFTTKSPEFHSGLGLTVSQKIFESLGGDLHYTSKEKNHNCFIVRVPVSGADERTLLNNLIQIHHNQSGA